MKTLQGGNGCPCSLHNAGAVPKHGALPATLPQCLDTSHFAIGNESSMLAQRRGFRGRGRNEGARTALVVGTLAAVAGAALLVYANRPECSGNPSANACGYGTKVTGSVVLGAGIVGLVVGALIWR